MTPLAGVAGGWLGMIVGGLCAGWPGVLVGGVVGAAVCALAAGVLVATERRRAEAPVYFPKWWLDENDEAAA